MSTETIHGIGASAGIAIGPVFRYEEQVQRVEDSAAEWVCLEAVLALAKMPMPLPPAIPEWVGPIVSIVPGQALALHLALHKGIDPDTPPGLHKVTRML